MKTAARWISIGIAVAAVTLLSGGVAGARDNDPPRLLAAGGEIPSPGPSDGDGVALGATGGSPVLAAAVLEPTPIPIANRFTTERPLTALSEEAARFAAMREGRVSVALLDFTTGTAYLYGADDRYLLASIGKVPLLLALLEQARKTGRPLTMVERQAIAAMIAQSDNDGATAVWRAVGRKWGVRPLLDRLQLGEPRIKVDYWDWGGMQAAAREVALLYGEIGGGQILSEQTRTWALSLMRRIDIDQSWGVSAGFLPTPGTATLALKNGWNPEGDGWQVHSAGVVRRADGTPWYALAILTGAQPSERYGIETVEGVARAINRSLTPVPWSMGWWW